MTCSLTHIGMKLSWEETFCVRLEPTYPYQKTCSSSPVSLILDEFCFLAQFGLISSSPIYQGILPLMPVTSSKHGVSAVCGVIFQACHVHHSPTHWALCHLPLLCHPFTLETTHTKHAAGFSLHYHSIMF